MSLLTKLVVLALVATPTALAGQPATQSLAPPPPSFETCKAVGGGTICSGARPEAYGPLDTGIPCAGFDIFDQGAFDQHAVRYYDANGNLTKRVIHEVYSLGRFTNPVTGAVVTYTQTDTRTDVLAVPGDLGSATEATTGQNIYHPASGAPVFLNAGRTVFRPDGTLESRAGPQGFLDYFVDGDTAVIDRLCGALS
jgi:hypothetical protein